ncbi:DUF2793 domain-containing protein [Hyphomonas sp.]|jgi:hypothetical protein|uniref:DUF2793 domain-containing protein n=1 Tax=Hyphomonas sp. TaxID=87 RepID=UPI00391BC244
MTDTSEHFTARIGLPYLLSGQAQKHVTVNEALRRLDVLVQLSAISASLAEEPGDAANGSVYILPPGKTGPSWNAMSNGALAAVIDGAWEEIQPREGWQAFVTDQGRSLIFDGETWTAPATVARERLSAARTYYVRADGNDANDGLANTPGSALATVQAALDRAGSLDLNGHDVTVQIANGTWTGTARFRTLTGDGTLILLGDETTPSNVYLNVSSAHAIAAQSVSGRYSVRGLKIETSGSGHAIAAAGTGVHITFRNIEFGAVANSHLFAEAGATIESIGQYAISGNAERHANALLRSEVNLRNSTVTLTGTPAFSLAFCNATRLSVINANGMTFTGSATGKRYEATANAVIFTNGGGATYLPGNASGTTATGAQYL